DVDRAREASRPVDVARDKARGGRAVLEPQSSRECAAEQWICGTFDRILDPLDSFDVDRNRPDREYPLGRSPGGAARCVVGSDLDPDRLVTERKPSETRLGPGVQVAVRR